MDRETSIPVLNQITLIGIGLIGGSFVLDLKKRGLVRRVVGIDTNHDNLARALERKVIDEAAENIDAASIGTADLVVIATPVATLPSICRAIRPFLSPQTWVTDVGSTKQSALAAFVQYLSEHLPNCVAAHPIAGSDRHGALAARFGLFEGKKLILCPNGQQNQAALNGVRALWQSIGAQTRILTAEEHDAVFAAVSHMPHVLAFSYVHQMKDHPDGHTYLDFAASGFRDFTRIASSHPAIWTDICLANRETLLALIEGQNRQLQRIAQMLSEQDSQALYRYFEEAKALRDEWLEHHE